MGGRCTTTRMLMDESKVLRDLIRVLQAERGRWNAVRRYAFDTGDEALSARLDEISQEYRDQLRGPK